MQKAISKARADSVQNHTYRLKATIYGVINDDVFYGYDVLSIPEGARGTAAVNAMTVPLHPVALAGYFGLVVNALALLPIGSKYDALVVGAYDT